MVESENFFANSVVGSVGFIPESHTHEH